MKPALAAVAFILVLCITVQPSSAQVFGHYATAATVGEGESMGGAYFTVADDILGLLGQFRYGYSGVADFGLQLGFNSMDDRVYAGGMFREEGETHLLIAGDGKYNLRRADEEMPVDVSVDFGVGYVDKENANQLLFSLSAQGGWSVENAGANTLSPYVGFALIVDRVSMDTSGGNFTDKDTDIQARIGAEYYISGSVSAVAELQTGTGTSFGVGLNIGF